MKTVFIDGVRELVEDSPSQFILRIFQSNAALNGGIVRRSTKSIEKFASEALLLQAVVRRGFKLYRFPNSYLIHCDQEGQFEQMC